MKILFLTRDLPFPANNGYKKRNFYLLKELKKRGVSTTLITKKSKELTGEAIEELRKYCDRVELVNANEAKSFWLRQLAKSMYSYNAFCVLRRYSKGLKNTISGMFKTDRYDAVICDSVYQAINIPPDADTKKILYEHNIESVIIKRYAEKEKNICKKIFAYMEFLKVERFQKKMWSIYDICITCSSLDKAYIKEKNPCAKIFVINNGVDRQYFEALSAERQPPTVNGKSPSDADSRSLVYTGQIGWHPNEDAVQYFTKEIFPLIAKEVEGITLWIVGANPSKNIKKLAEKNRSIKITGFVDDVRAYISRASVYIVPLRIGSGTRLKILEAMSMKKAIVTTSIGCEGLDVQDGKDLLIRDNPNDFAGAVVELIKNKDLSTSLGISGRRLVEKMYDWNTVFKDLDKILDLAEEK